MNNTLRYTTDDMNIAARQMKAPLRYEYADAEIPEMPHDTDYREYDRYEPPKKHAIGVTPILLIAGHTMLVNHHATDTTSILFHDTGTAPITYHASYGIRLITK